MSLVVYHTAKKAKFPMIVFNNSSCLRCAFSTEVKPMSKRKQFRQIIPDYNIINKLDDLQLGYNAKRKVRIAVAKKFGNIRGKAPIIRQKTVQQVLRSQRYESPYPFRKFGVKLHSASTYSEVPDVFYGNPTPTEVAVIGRSNVGKSTLLNSLLAYDDSYIQKAPVSDKPGYTRDLGFYGLGIHPIKNIPINSVSPELVSNTNKTTNLDASSGNRVNSTKTKANTIETDENKIKRLGSAIVLVDMPGYGFSYMNENELKRVHDLCSDYLRYRGPNLKRVILLLDARHGFKIGDKEYFKRLVDGEVMMEDNANDDDKNNRSDNNSSISPSVVASKSTNNHQKEIKKGKTEIYFEFSNSPKNKNLNNISSSNNNNSNTTPSKTKLKKLKKNINWKLQIVLTKCDLLDRTELARRIQTVQDSIAEMLPGYGNMLSVLALSGKFGNGVLDLKKELASLVTPPTPWEHTNSTAAAAAALTLSPPTSSSSSSSSPTISASLNQNIGIFQNASSTSLNSNRDIKNEPFKYVPSSSWTSTMPPILTTYKYTGSKKSSSRDDSNSSGRSNSSGSRNNDNRNFNRKQSLLGSRSDYVNDRDRDSSLPRRQYNEEGRNEMNKRSNKRGMPSSSSSRKNSYNDDDYDDDDDYDSDDDDNESPTLKPLIKSKPRWRDIGKTHPSPPSSSSSSSSYKGSSNTKAFKSSSSSSSYKSKAKFSPTSSYSSSSARTDSSTSNGARTVSRMRLRKTDVEKKHRHTTSATRERVSSTKRRPKRTTAYNDDD